LGGGTGLAAAAVRINVSPTLPGSSTASSGAPRQVVVNVLKAAQARSRQREDIVVSGGTSAEQDLLREILSSMPDSSITSVSIVPKEYLGTTGVGLEFAVLPGDFPRSQWEEMLLTGAFRALSTERGLAPVVGLPPQDRNYSPSTETPADVEANIAQAASEVDAEVVQIRVYQAYGIEPAVILKVDDPGPFLKDRLSTFLDAIHVYSHSYGALYAEVIDSNGAFAWGYGVDTLTSTSFVGTRPDLAGCNPVQVIGFGIQPPCPTS
jgi:hypothetical protein